MNRVGKSGGSAIRFCLLFLSAPWAADSMAVADQKAVQIGRPTAQSGVPPWDLRGSDLLPWQGIACVDMSPDGALAEAGTIARSQARRPEA